MTVEQDNKVRKIHW